MRKLFCLFFILLATSRAEEVPSETKVENLEAQAAPVEVPSLGEKAVEVTEQPSATPPERELRDSFKESLETHDLSSMTSPAVPFHSGHGGQARHLQDGNPIFRHEFHDSPIDYFQIVLFDYDPNVDRLSAFRGFLLRWMNIDHAKESLDIARLNIQNNEINNRYRVTYQNSETGVSKQYFFDVDFSDGRSDRSRVSRVRTIDYLHNSESNNNYLKQYEYTLEEDCRTIQQARHNPAEIECRPFVTRDHFVIPHVYTVTMRYRFKGRTVRRRGRFFVRSRIIGPEVSPLKPEPVRLPSPPQIIRLIRDRIRATPFFENKEVVLAQLRQKQMRQRIQEYSNQIAHWELSNKDRLRSAERRYHTNLRNALRTDRRNKRRDDINFEQTYGLMRRAANRVNAFNIRNAIRRTARRLEDRQVIRSHGAKARYYQREIALMELMEKLDHMRYLADKHLDENFDHYYAAEYFGK